MSAMTMFQNLHRSLPPHQRLQIECGACGRKASWTRDEAFRKLGLDATPPDIRRRLVCGACGRGDAVRIWI
jgi:hypothetical protein